MAGKDTAAAREGSSLVLAEHRAPDKNPLMRCRKAKSQKDKNSGKKVSSQREVKCFIESYPKHIT